MGFLGMGNYNKPGPGISKNAPEKKRFFKFFELYFRKFWKLIQLNLLYILFWIPALVAGYFALSLGDIAVTVVFTVVGAFTIGPATAGFTYVIRNYVREEHAFMASDFWDNFKSNFRQAVIVYLLFSGIMSIAWFSLLFYINNLHLGTIYYVAMGITAALLLVVIAANFYVYMLMVTMNLPTGALIKNSFIFSIIGIRTNVFTFLFAGPLLIAQLLFIIPFGILTLPLFGLSLCWFIVCFNAYPWVKKYCIDPAMAKAAEENPPEELPEGEGPEGEQDDTVFEDHT
ncbi:MAG: DUF624 domain-containing protein [Oscillospiraceae bacterium]|nr:DUF624 domain-containing protein [Oscillospiraceae bacterium]